MLGAKIVQESFFLDKKCKMFDFCRKMKSFFMRHFNTSCDLITLIRNLYSIHNIMPSSNFSFYFVILKYEVGKICNDRYENCIAGKMT